MILYSPLIYNSYTKEEKKLKSGRYGEKMRDLSHSKDKVVSEDNKRVKTNQEIYFGLLHPPNPLNHLLPLVPGSDLLVL